MYARKEGFILKQCTLEHPARNVSTERFMSVIVKVVHAVIAEGKDPKVNLWKSLRNYRNNPHPSTGKTLAELIIVRQLKTRIKTLLSPSSTKVNQEAEREDRDETLASKKRFDKTHKASKQEIKKGEKVVIKEEIKTIKSFLNTKPFTFIDVKGMQVEAKIGIEINLRNRAKVRAGIFFR